MILGRSFNAKMGGLEKLKQAFLLYLLQFKGFRWIMKFDEKWIAKVHAKSSKIETAGVKGQCFFDFVNIWEAPVFWCFSVQQEFDRQS